MAANLLFHPAARPMRFRRCCFSLLPEARPPPPVSYEFRRGNALQVPKPPQQQQQQQQAPRIIRSTDLARHPPRPPRPPLRRVVNARPPAPIRPPGTAGNRRQPSALEANDQQQQRSRLSSSSDITKEDAETVEDRSRSLLGLLNEDAQSTDDADMEVLSVKALEMRGKLAMVLLRLTGMFC